MEKKNNHTDRKGAFNSLADAQVIAFSTRKNATYKDVELACKWLNTNQAKLLLVKSAVITNQWLRKNGMIK